MRHKSEFMPTNTRNFRFLIALLAFLLVKNSFAQTFFSENFNGPSVPASWQIINQGTGDCRWVLHPPTSYAGTSLSMRGSNFLYANSDSAGNGTLADETIISPLVSIPSGTTQASLEFYHHFKCAGGFTRKDTAIVEVFTGTTWIPLKKYYSATGVGTGTSPVKTTLDLTPYINPGLRIRFRYVGDWAYYWAIDDVRIYSPFLNDLGVTSIQPPTDLCGLPNPFTVKVKVKNFGGAPQNNIPLFYRVGSETAVSEIMSATINPGDSATYTFNQVYSGNGPGDRIFKAWTDISTDQQRSNDSVSAVFSAPPATLGLVNFAGFNGLNLSSIHPGWSEANGIIPSGTTSAWSGQSSAQATFLGSPTAKINLYTTGNRSWMISPPFFAPQGATIKFRIAITGFNNTQSSDMGSDDSLLVKVSADCGQTWTTIRTITNSENIGNQLVSREASLTSVAGQALRIAFYATDGAINDVPDYDVHITGIEVGVSSPVDLALTDIMTPPAECGIPIPYFPKVTISNTGSETQSGFQVFYSIDGGAPVSETYSDALASGSSIAYAFGTPASVSSGLHTISAWVKQAGDQVSENDSLKNKPISRAELSIPKVTFSGYSGGNLNGLFSGWKESFGLPPTGTTSAWEPASSAQKLSLGSETAKVNLYGIDRTDWIISPPFSLQPGNQLRYKLAITNFNSTSADSMGSDDSLLVKISTDCGQSWQTVRWHTKSSQLTNSLTEQIVPLNQFVGQTILIGFLADDGTINNSNDYDLHIDDIEVLSLSANDLGVTSVFLPDTTCGLPSAFPVKVKVKNAGMASQSSVLLTYQVTGQPAVAQTFPVNLVPGAEIVLQFATQVQSSALSPGLNEIAAWVSLNGDSNQFNDTLRVPFRKEGPELFLNTFTGYSGTNLSSVFPGWKEMFGDIPSGTTSGWKNSNPVQTAEFNTTTARVNLFSDVNRDWMISPFFVPVQGSKLRFQIALTDYTLAYPDSMGSDDTLKVLISTNCGTTWKLLRGFTKADHLTNVLTTIIIDLSEYDGQPCQVAFFGNDGLTNDPEDYELHIDNVEVGMFTGLMPRVSSKNKFTLVPNPASEVVSLQWERETVLKSVELFSADGKRQSVQASQEENNKLIIDLKGVAAGMYYLRVVTDKEVSAVPLMVR